MSRISHFSRILLLLTLALLPRLAQTQRIGPLGPTDRQQSKALSTERTAAVGPPSLQLSLPPPAVAALPPLGPDDSQLLQPQEGQPPIIGIHRPLPQGSVALSFSGGTARTTAEGAWQAIPAGRLWRLRITSPGARAMRVHFRDFAIGAGKLWLYSADGQTVGPYAGSGLYGDGNFWSDIVSGDSLTIEYLPDPATTEEAVPFQIVEISHIWDDSFGNGGEAGVQPPIAASGGARTGREAAKLLTDWINVVVGTQPMEQSPAADNPPDTKTARIAKQIQLVERSASLQQPRPKAARALTPGLPVSFSQGPVDSPTLFRGNFSYQLEIPEDASRVTFTLESVDPDVDVDLYVRFGEDNAVQDRRVVTDYRSEGLTGNEEIVITPQSDPPLRAGTYFVSVALFDTGVVAMATLTAEVERDDTPLPPISGGTLTPGQPSAFRLGPVESPTLFNGDKSFRMEVPTGASRVIFTMESVDPDVDVDLYVRFGEDNMIQNGRPVFDHRSQKLTGNERIGITRRSDPPLRAGTYFVSVLVFDTGVVAEGTLTATVETDAADCHLDATCYTEWSSSAAGVALIMIETSEGSSSCSGTLLNNSRQDFTPYFLTAAHCVDAEEEARSVIAFWHYQTQTCNGELPDILSVPRTMGASLLSTLGGGMENTSGDITLLRLGGDLPDGVMFQGWDADPQPVGTQITGIHHPGSDDWGFFKRISFGQIIPDPRFGTSADVYAIVSWPPGQGYTEGGSSGSALFSSPGTVIGALSFGDTAENACPTGPFLDAYTHFSVVYPHIRQFIDIDSPLTPGQPATFRLEPVDTPTIFLGDSSFRLEVPENASRVTFTLESVDPDINVDLYVRYGEDNDIRDGRVISDYSSEGPTGNEEIIITRQSDPPLRAGTYFVSLGVRTTGVVAEGTVRAEFDTPLQTGDQIYYFPHLAVGASWQTTITYINYSREEVTCQTDFISDHGTPLMVSFAELGTVDSRTDVLPPGGSVHQETNVALSAPLAPGWARATCSGPVQASLLFRQHSSEGMPVAEAGVNATAVPATRFVTFAEQGEDQFGTGVAYANPSAISVPVTFTARDGVGEVLASVVRTLSPGGHDAHGMAGLFGLTSFTGSLEVTSTEPIVSLSLNFEAAPVFSSLPPGELDASAQGSTTYYFPHLAVGEGWQTTITYINYSPQEVTCQTEFLSDHGSPLMVSFAALGTVVSRTDVLPPGGSVHQETNVDLNASLAPGWARATCSGPVQASLLYRLHNSEGAPTAEAGVNATAVPATRFVTFAEQGEGQFGTGVAYANPSAISVPVTFTARDGVGEVLASVVRTLSPGGHDAHGMAGLFGLTSFTGSLEVTSTVPIVSLSLNFEAAPVFSSLPPGDIPGEMLAPTDEAAFNDLFVGKRATTNYPTVYVDFVSPGRFRETEGSDIWTGSYTYRNTGPNTGTVTFNYDDGDRCVASFTFVSTTAGTATYTCNDGSSGGSNWLLVAISATGTPDLVVQTPSVSDSNPNAGESFTLSAAVRNQGNGLSASTTLRYYRSPDATISTSDTAVGTDAVGGLAASGTSAESISLTAPSAAGTYYYGACVDPVSGESDTGNNCSSGVRVTAAQVSDEAEFYHQPKLVEAGLLSMEYGVWEKEVNYDSIGFLFSEDFDGDGDDDVLIAGAIYPSDSAPPTMVAQQGAILLNNGDFTFSVAEGDRPSSVHPREVLLADFNGDGKNDFFIADHGYDVDPFPGWSNQLLLATDEGYEDASGRLPDDNTGFTHNAAVGDADGDGDVDILVANHGGEFRGGAPYLLLNDGAANFTVNQSMLPERVVNDTDYWPWAADMLDLDLDGHVDLLMGGNDDSGQSYVHWGPDFQRLTVLPASDYFVGFGGAVVISIASHDFNNDGLADVLLGGYDDGTVGHFPKRGVQMLINQGDRRFRDETQRRLGDSAWSPTEGWHMEHRFFDFNHDGTVDIVPQSYDHEGSNLVGWLNDGTGHFVALKTTVFSDTEALKRLAWGVKVRVGTAWKSLEFFGDGTYLQSNAAITVTDAIITKPD